MPRLDHAYTLSKALLQAGPTKRLVDLNERLQAPIQRTVFYELAKWLQFHGAVRYHPPDPIHVDVRRLLDLLASVRRSNLVPKRGTAAKVDPTTAHHLLVKARVPHCFGFMTAGNLAAFYEPQERLHLYVGPGGLRAVRKAIGSGRTEIEFYVERLGRLPQTQNADGLPITELLRTAIDTRAHPQGGAYATILEDAIRKGI